ncbi:MAG TPA: MarR family transcriptional regulator [Myxococcales bacterium]|jgi:DNA-binding MarR family transcriptional regulator
MGKQIDRRQGVEELGVLIARSRRMMAAAASRRLEARGESILVWQVLNRLRREGALTQCELAFQTGQHPAGISRMLDGIEGEGLVVRTRDAEDRRKMRVELTKKALQRLAVTDPDVNAAAQQFLSPLSPAEQRTLRELLRKLVGDR